MVLYVHMSTVYVVYVLRVIRVYCTVYCTSKLHERVPYAAWVLVHESVRVPPSCAANREVIAAGGTRASATVITPCIHTMLCAFWDYLGPTVSSGELATKLKPVLFSDD